MVEASLALGCMLLAIPLQGLAAVVFPRLSEEMGFEVLIEQYIWVSEKDNLVGHNWGDWNELNWEDSGNGVSLSQYFEKRI